MPQIDQLPAGMRQGQLRGGAWRLLHAQRREVVIAGPAGTGKSLACLAKLHGICWDVPGVRCLVVRKTRVSLTESGLVTLEEKVMGPRARRRVLHAGGGRATRKAYHYPNGSVIVVGGMDHTSKIMSTEFDLIYVQEAIELTEPDWEALLSRLRNGVLGYQQILADTNPDAPHHWIKQRASSGKLDLIESRHEDNPRFHDGTSWTPEGNQYLATLDQLTGPRLQRLRFGKWVGAEGAVYEEFSRAVHVVDRIPGCNTPFAILPAPEWPRYLAIDFGYTNAFVALWGAVDPDGRLWLYRQLVRTQVLVQDHAAAILQEMQEEERRQRNRIVGLLRDKEMELGGQESAGRWAAERIASLPRLLKPKVVICDHDAEDRATLERYLKMPTKAANKAISPGIQALAARLRVQEDGRARLLITAASLVARDPKMDVKKLPIGFAEEAEGYVWNVEGGRRKGEEPVDKNNHVMDAARYMVAELDLNVKREARVH